MEIYYLCLSTDRSDRFWFFNAFLDLTIDSSLYFSYTFLRYVFFLMTFQTLFKYYDSEFYPLVN